MASVWMKRLYSGPVTGFAYGRATNHTKKTFGDRCCGWKKRRKTTTQWIKKSNGLKKGSRNPTDSRKDPEIQRIQERIEKSNGFKKGPRNPTDSRKDREIQRIQERIQKSNGFKKGSRNPTDSRKVKLTKT
ncbi:hypothetical protein TNCT_279521 [Trichonephila clavata]|uniref:Uncharacterized protein n=1 Tax=Trichonephila clavata TaxID=2740835 RepID=A0A8X6HVK0_TRICU|nr:hypothetical protein TNCT_279521 [Trichonephila clavata]